MGPAVTGVANLQPGRVFFLWFLFFSASHALIRAMMLIFPVFYGARRAVIICC